MSYRQKHPQFVDVLKNLTNDMNKDNKDIIRSDGDKQKFISDIKQIIAHGQLEAYSSASHVQIKTYWLIGRRIVEEEQHGSERADYGRHLLDDLSKEISRDYPKDYSPRDLRNYRQFYLRFRDFEIWYACVPNLSWTHYRSLLRVDDDNARYWYLKEASQEMWNTRTLDRNIGSQYYYRLLQSPKKENVIAEMKRLTNSNTTPAKELIKSPVVAEFLGLPSSIDYTESQLETAILNHIREFIMEMGRGFAFVARQKHIVTDMGDFYIDLVFYNYILKCFFLIDLKTTRISHQDVGQMDMYIRMFDELMRTEGDNPTIGLLLCSETSEDIARYSILSGNQQLFASKYLTYLPTKEQLRQEIERQKEIFRLQHEKDNNDGE